MAILLTAVDFIGMKEEYTEIVKFVMLAYYIVEWAFIMFMRYYYQNPFPLWMEIQVNEIHKLIFVHIYYKGK